MTSDLDCNRVAFWPQYPEVTHRCTQPEGHVEPCWVRGVEVLNPQHRKPVPSFEDPFELVPLGGRRRGLSVAASDGVQRVRDGMCRRIVSLAGGAR